MGQVIPAINETVFSEIEKKMRAAREFGAEWVHIDVADGKFTKNTLWNNPKELSAIRHMLSANLEVHLMVENPDDVLDDWIDAGAKRIIVHIEAAKDIPAMKEKCMLMGAEFFLAANPETSARTMVLQRDFVDGFLVLAVTPGVSGQQFHEDQLAKIAVLREHAPGGTIEVDGGVNLSNAADIRKEGATILVAASAIWGSNDPQKAYQQLTRA
ncbi:MAG: hypothetical protein KGI60_01235 [Patescibacteria group bacterium]|nr:hypothetical protein [Patescibacteria group bacterium]